MMRQSVPFAEDARGMSLPVNSISDDMLHQALDRAVADENYELASCLRDEIKRRGVGRKYTIFLCPKQQQLWNCRKKKLRMLYGYCV